MKQGIQTAARHHPAVTALALLLLLLACALTQAAELDGATIVKRAQEAAGGARWRDAQSLKLSGRAEFYRGGRRSQHSIANSYEMWRVFPGRSEDAHAANGKVRFDARNDEQLIFQISFDGEHSYDQNGRINDEAATKRWKSNFGFGIFRFALGDGFEVERMADDSIEGHRCYFVKVIDPGKRSTLFAVDRASYAIRMVGFDTPQGFHHRIYDAFVKRPGEAFVQPGSVRLYYDGVKTADIHWNDFAVNPDIDPQTFVLAGPGQQEPTQ